MHSPYRQLAGLAAIGLVGVALLGAWLVQRESKMPPPIEAWELGTERAKTELDSVRERLYELRERHRHIVSLNASNRHKNQISSLEVLQKWIEDCASRLGQTLRPDPEVKLEPEAFFVSYTQGSCRMKLLEWAVKGASAAYTFEIGFSHRDIPDQVIRDVRERDVVGDLRLLASGSPTKLGKTYEVVDRVTPRGKEIKRTVKLPDYRILQLTFQRVPRSAESLVLEDAYSERDRSKAHQSGVSFDGGVDWDIPLATLAFRDGQAGEIRSVTTKKGSRFLFANIEYEVIGIRPDAIEVSPVGSDGKVETWMRREPPPDSL
ncbi:MAG: hypothetical protein ACKOKC_06305 [Chthoniobacterales bacterium]